MKYIPIPHVFIKQQKETYTDIFKNKVIKEERNAFHDIDKYFKDTHYCFGCDLYRDDTTINIDSYYNNIIYVCSECDEGATCLICNGKSKSIESIGRLYQCDKNICASCYNLESLEKHAISNLNGLV